MNSKFKILITLISAIFLSSVVVSVFIYIQTSKNITETSQNIKEIKEQESRDSQAKSLESLVERTEDTVDTLKKYLLPDSDIVHLVEVLESLGRETKTSVNITALEAEDSSSLDYGAINKVKAHIEVSGSWDGVLAFMTFVESLPYKSTISNVTLRKSEISEKQKNSNWGLSFNIDILKIK